ncbi:MAG TPA: insulinase family protein [Bacteroidia bacterium]|nr:insulinase family protein [Bacteroidia bacterium]
MKKHFFVLALLALSFSAFAGDKQYKYDTVPNDPLHGRIYHLDNGFTVFISVNKSEPRIQTYIATKAGSKFDPHDATGLAHYLEHMLFKGTDKFGSNDYAKEKPELDKIENLYEVYRHTTDPEKRKKLYHQIDSVSYVASGYAIANEYDKLMSSIGARGTNAFTSVEQTVFQEDIPSNEMTPWLEIESERYRNPVMRLFHTELEAVYEEKNRNLDDDNEKTEEALLAQLFKKHPYGTQTTIGTIHDLKNPSLTEILKYYHTYYVPNNMVMALSGDVNPDEAIKEIDKYFGPYVAKPVPTFNPPKEDPITSPTSETVYGPSAASVTIGYRFAGAGSRDADMIDLIQMLLSNGQAGLFDLDLMQQEKVQSAGVNNNIFMDYSYQEFQAIPKEGQSLEEAKNIVLTELDKLKKGDFPDWMIEASVNNLKLQQIQQFRSNSVRALTFVIAFTTGESWADAISENDRLAKITKKDIMDFATAHYANNYAVVYKKVGEDTTIEKVQKPVITPVQTNAKAESQFVRNIEAEKVAPITPVFVDYKKEIQTLSVKNELPVYYVQNTEDSTFNMYYIFDMGSKNSKLLQSAINYLKYTGTSKLRPEEVQQEFYKLACTYTTFCDKDRLYVNLSGLTRNFTPALQLFENLIADAKPDTTAMHTLIDVTLKQREDNKLDKNTILFSALASYGTYGPVSPYTYILTNDELRNTKPEALTEVLHNLCQYNHHVLYYGSQPAKQLVSTLSTYHTIPSVFKPLPQGQKFEQVAGTNQVYVVDHDMKQTEVIILERGGNHYDPTLNPVISMYNEYFGGSMASVSFQVLRESKALAYSTFCRYSAPSDSVSHYSNLAYIGSQADKLGQATDGMMQLLNDSIPQYEQLWSTSKDAILKGIASTRIIREGILFNFENARRLGIDYDTRKLIFDKLPTLTFADIQKFHKEYIAKQPYTILVMGNKKDIDMKALEKYGKVTFLTMQDIFGY